MDSSRRYQDLLQLLSLSPQSHSTCVGIAVSTRQQCRCRVALKRRDQATQVLYTVAIASLTIESIKEKMRLVAELLLCRRYHQDQSTGLSSEWTDKLRSSQFTTHTATLHAALDREVLDPATAPTESPELSRRYLDLLQLLSLSPQSHSTCVGIAISTKQQCRCPVALKRRDQATQILSTVAIASLTIESINEKMGLVAKLLLCRRFHQDQSTGLSSEWTDKLRSSQFTTHTATLHAALDREVLDPATASTESPELSRRYLDLLQLLSLSPQSHSTCVGIAISTKQQCRRTVALKRRDQATQVLSTVAIASLTTESINEKMGLVAKLLLCRSYLQDQSTGLSSEWTDKLRPSQFMTHTVTLHTALDREFLDPATASTEAPELSVGTTAPRAQRRMEPEPPSTTLRSAARATRGSHQARRRIEPEPLSMTLRSAATVTRGSHQACPICLDEYGPRDDTVILCMECQNIYCRGCGRKWRREHNTCPSCRRENTLVERPHPSRSSER